MHYLLTDNDHDEDGVELMAATQAAEDRGELHTCQSNGDAAEPECWFCGAEMGEAA